MTVLQLLSEVLASPKGASLGESSSLDTKSYANQNSLKSSFGNRATLWETRVAGLGKGNARFTVAHFHSAERDRH